MRRSQALVESLVSTMIVIDTAHGTSAGVAEAVRRAAGRLFKHVQDRCGQNVGHGRRTRALIDSGGGSVKVGIRPGSICTADGRRLLGCPQLNAIIDCVKRRAMCQSSA